MAEPNHVLRPTPRRAFELTPIPTEPSTPPSPENTNAELLDARLDGGSPPSRTRSFLNLTSSTLFGIYSPTGDDASRDELNTPWGTGAQTPSFRSSYDEQIPQDMTSWEAEAKPQESHLAKVGWGEYIWSMSVRGALLFGFGVAYGTIITHLHENDQVVPVKVRDIDRKSWPYLLFWGASGVALGNLLPWIDAKSTPNTFAPTNGFANGSAKNGSRSEKDQQERDLRPSTPTSSNLGADWNPVVRSIGAFVGIAFAIRRLQWQSTLQVSLTLALVNPCLWYLIDRTATGFSLSAIVGVLGTIILMLVNPGTVPPPNYTTGRSLLASELSEKLGNESLITDERIGVATWIASVLFCSCVCFGNIGRRLAMEKAPSTTQAWH